MRASPKVNSRFVLQIRSLPKIVTYARITASMGFGESLKSLLLFSLRKGYQEVHFEEGRLPFIVNSAGHRAVINGIMPLSKEQISETKKMFFNGRDCSVTEISGADFMLLDLGKSIVFRQLPKVEKPKSYNQKLARACLSKKGVLLFVYENQKDRILNSYKAASILVDVTKVNLVVAETNKYYGIDAGNSKITNIFRPELELSLLLRMIDQASFDCILVPDCQDNESALTLNAVSTEKIVIAGISPSVLDCFNVGNVIYGTKEKQKGAVLYTDAIIKNLEV